jgi:hypothetical protein
VIGLVASSCITTVCSTGTRQVGDNCVAESSLDLSTGGGSNSCGAGTMSMGGACVPAAGACGPGTNYDPTTQTCQITRMLGTSIWTSTMTNQWMCTMKRVIDADAGATYVPVGTEGALNTGESMSTPLFLAGGAPMGGQKQIPVVFYTGNTTQVPNALENQMTVATWAGCKGTWAIYKDPPSGKKTYKVAVTLTGCPPNTGWSVWGFFSADGTYDNLLAAFPLGGLPDFMMVGLDGTAYWERDIDPAVWLKEGTEIAGSWHGPMGQNPHVPSETDFPKATFHVDALYHNTGQSNGNTGYCAVDKNGNCVTPADTSIFLPGQFGADIGPALTGALTADGPMTTKPIPIGMVQPY